MSAGANGSGKAKPFKRGPRGGRKHRPAKDHRNKQSKKSMEKKWPAARPLGRNNKRLNANEWRNTGDLSQPTTTPARKCKGNRPQCVTQTWPPRVPDGQDSKTPGPRPNTSK